METLKKLPGWLMKQARYLYERYPVRVTSALSAAAIFICAKTGIVVSEQSIGAALAYALPIALGPGLVAHNKVEPVKGVRKPAPLLKRKRSGSG